MPLVKVFFRAPFDNDLIHLLGGKLPAIVADALMCDHPDGKLEPGDVEVDVEPMPNGMRTDYDLHIEVEANDYPDRKANLDERWLRIDHAVRIFLAGRLPVTDLLVRPKGWIWVKLFPAKWGEIWPVPPASSPKKEEEKSERVTVVFYNDKLKQSEEPYDSEREAEEMLLRSGYKLEDDGHWYRARTTWEATIHPRP